MRRWWRRNTKREERVIAGWAIGSGGFAALLSWAYHVPFGTFVVDTLLVAGLTVLIARAYEE